MGSELYLVGFTFAAAAAVLYLIIYAAGRARRPAETAPTDDDAPMQNGAVSACKPVARARERPGARKDKQQTFAHPWLFGSLKGHAGRVLDVDLSANGRHAVSCADDRSLLLWSAKEFDTAKKRTVRAHVQLDHARLVRFAPDSKSFVAVHAQANCLAIYKLHKDDGGALHMQTVDSIQFAEQHKHDIICCGIASTGKFIMTASGDTTVVVWDLRGGVLKTLDTKQSNIYHAAVSPCGRFVASSGFTPDVKVWQVVFNRAGEFQDVSRAFELKGHNSGVFAFDFNQDSTRMLSVSRDGTWRLWDTDIRFAQGQEPRVLATGDLAELRDAHADGVRAALAPDGHSFLVAVYGRLRAFAADTAADAPPRCIDDVHAADAFSALRFSPDSRLFATAGDRHVHLFHNVPGYEAELRRLREQAARPQGDAHKRRVQQQIEETHDKLAAILSASD